MVTRSNHNDHDILIELKTGMGYLKEGFVAGNTRMEGLEKQVSLLKTRQAYIIGGAAVASTLVTTLVMLVMEMV